MDGGISDEKAKEAAKLLKRYCQESGCVYCAFSDLDGPDLECNVNRPREWRIEDDK